MVNVFGVDSGVDIRRGYSQLRHRAPYTMFFFGFGLCIFCSLLKGSVPRDIRCLLLTTVGPEPNIALILDYLENLCNIGGSFFSIGK
jgi:hypothetical protein